jgi:hypothetical protein
MVEEMLAERGICVSYETVRQWAMKFGEAFSDQIRQRVLRAATNGISTKSSFRSPESHTGCGVRSIKTASCSTFWFSVEETAARRAGS